MLGIVISCDGCDDSVPEPQLVEINAGPTNNITIRWIGYPDEIPPEVAKLKEALTLPQTRTIYVIDGDVAPRLRSGTTMAEVGKIWINNNSETDIGDLLNIFRQDSGWLTMIRGVEGDAKETPL